VAAPMLFIVWWSNSLVVAMKVQVTAVGELSTVQVDFETIAGGVSQAVNDLCTATSEFIEQRLLKLSEQLNQGGEGA